MFDDLYTVEYSVKQDSFHIAPLVKTMETNLYAMVNKRSNDYQLVALCVSAVKASEAVEELRKMIER